MKRIMLYLFCVPSLWALEGRLQLGYLGPLREDMMLERRTLGTRLFSDSFWATDFQLEQRSFENIYTESRATILPALIVGSWQLGLGAHYRAQRIAQLNVDHSHWLPAVSAAWRNSALLLRGQFISADLFEGEVAFLRQLLVPLEFNFSYRRDALYFDGSRFSLLAYLHPQAGAGARYYAASEALSVMGWLRPTEHLAVRLEYHLPSALRPVTAMEFSLEYRFGSAMQRSIRMPVRSAAVLEAPLPVQHTQHKIPAPEYAVMVRRGVAPIEALEIARANNVCVGSLAARRLLQVPAGSCE